MSLVRANEELYRLDAAVRARQVEAVQSSIARLDRLLFEPHRRLLRRAARVVVVPDAVTMVIPFSGLAIQWRRAGQHGVTVTIAPSLSVVAIAEPRPQTRRLLALGNESTGYDGLPRLQNVPRELGEIASLYEHSWVQLAPSVSVEGLKTLVTGYHIVHIAAHSVVEMRARAIPRIVLGAGTSGVLTGPKIRSLRFAPRTTVILSSCSTAARGADGFDPLSLAAEFSLAGVASVIAAIWEIPDQGAVDLFRQIHARLLRGDSAAMAVANTQDWAIGSSNPTLALASMSLAAIESAIVN